MRPSSFSERVFCGAIGFALLLVALLIIGKRVRFESEVDLAPVASDRR